jgi:two-component system, OmpR family, response regulator
MAEDGLRVMIVDDDPDVATVLGMLLGRSGYSVEALTDSTQCLSRAETFHPDVILMDIAMPKVTGLDLAKRIRTQPTLQDVAIITMSGYSDAEHRAQSLEAGCDEYLVKPITRAEFEAAIGHQVRIRRSRRAQLRSCDNMARQRATEMNRPQPEAVVRQSVPLMTHERNAVLKRLAQIEVVLGHPRLTAQQSAALIRERAKLERKLAAVDSND